MKLIPKDSPLPRSRQTKQRENLGHLFPIPFIWLKQIHLKHLLYTNLNLILANLIHQK